MAFYLVAEPGSRIEISIEITNVARLDARWFALSQAPLFLTVSDADMIESKILAFLNAPFCRVRDVLDIFLFQDALQSDASSPLSQKLKISLCRLWVRSPARSVETNRAIQLREMKQLLGEQVARGDCQPPRGWRPRNDFGTPAAGSARP